MPKTDSAWSNRGQGYYAYDKEDRRILCPKCKNDYIVYNGNYYCAGWTGSICKWALPHPSVKESDRLICDKIGVDYE